MPASLFERSKRTTARLSHLDIEFCYGANTFLTDFAPLREANRDNYYGGELADEAQRMPYSPVSDAFPRYLVSPDGITFSTSSTDLSSLQYTVISYTWGRWMRETREADTPVVGGHWKVPANELFSRAELNTAVRNIGGHGNTWMDVLCIPQADDDPEKAIS